MHLLGVTTQLRFLERGSSTIQDTENNLKFQEVFGRLGLKEKVNEDDSSETEKCLCVIYDRKRLSFVGKVRLELFLKKYKPKKSKLISNMKKFDGSQLPPCSRVL